MESISKLCGAIEEDVVYALKQTEIQLLSFSVTLLTMLLPHICMYVCVRVRDMSPSLLVLLYRL